jgi:hypothetical protein
VGGELQYWQKLDKIIQDEPSFEEFRPMYGLLASLGIEKDRAGGFSPDERMKEILERSAKSGAAVL